jgi:hypothetical protein
LDFGGVRARSYPNLNVNGKKLFSQICGIIIVHGAGDFCVFRSDFFFSIARTNNERLLSITYTHHDDARTKQPTSQS